MRDGRRRVHGTRGRLSRDAAAGLGGTEDSTKFQCTGAALGTPHNPGYPLYMVACYAFSKLPFGTLAYGINLLSAFWGATSATLVFLAMRRIAIHWWIATFVALGLGLGRAFWAHSVITEAYTQVSAFTAAALLALLAWDQTGRERWLYAAVAAASLAFGTHLIIAGAVPALAWFVLSRFRWRIPLRVLAVMATIVALGFAQYGYVSIRSVQGASPLDPGRRRSGNSWTCFVPDNSRARCSRSRRWPSFRRASRKSRPRRCRNWVASAARRLCWASWPRGATGGAWPCCSRLAQPAPHCFS